MQYIQSTKVRHTNLFVCEQADGTISTAKVSIKKIQKSFFLTRNSTTLRGC